jgi:hypothetical protein
MRELSDRWRELILKAWDPDIELSKLLPAIVREIKATKRNAEAETALFTLFQSPMVQSNNNSARLLTPSTVQPAYQLMNAYADAAGHPPGKGRTDALSAISAAMKDYEIALTPKQIVSVLERKPKEPIKKKMKDAADQRAKRARRDLGISRNSGRPRKPD